MKRVINASSGVDLNYYDKFEDQIAIYLPVSGEGNTFATQIVTAICKLVYKYYNDGDVYDNTHGLEGWYNDLSDYANWLHTYLPECRNILSKISDTFNEAGYENILRELSDLLLDESLLSAYNSMPKLGSIYNCEGPYSFEEYLDDDDEDEYEYYEDEDDDYEYDEDDEDIYW